MASVDAELMAKALAALPSSPAPTSSHSRQDAPAETPTPGTGEATNDIRWAVNVLLEKIAAKFEAWETFDLFRSEAASIVRSFKHDHPCAGEATSEPPTVRETCVDCGKIDPCDEDCPNWIDPPQAVREAISPADLAEVLENVRAAIAKLSDFRSVKNVPIELHKACHSLEHLTKGLRG